MGVENKCEQHLYKLTMIYIVKLVENKLLHKIVYINYFKTLDKIMCMKITEITDMCEYYKIEFEGMSFTIEC